LRYPKRTYTFSVDYFSTPESVDPEKIKTVVREVFPDSGFLYFQFKQESAI